MEQTSDPLPGNQAGQSSSPRGELIIQNGRLRGTHRALTTPITTVGRAENCDLRLNVDSVHPFQCVLAFGPTGLTLRHLPADNGTLVNGQAVTVCTLHEGDLLSIGPFHFQVHLPGDGSAAATTLEQDKQGLRIQAAAVAAQQAALTEEEIRLQHRRVALEQQEQQLATHLEEKRQQLISLRDEAREAHAALQQGRTAYEERVAQIMDDLARSRRELAESQRQVQAERQHLLDLRQRLKRRFHRHWAGERMAMRLREAEVAKQRRDLNKESERLQQEKADLMQARIHFNGESELGRRRLQADWKHLRKEQAEVAERAGILDQREAALDRGERELADEKRHWEEFRLQLHQEAEGLESRVANFRRKLLDQEQERNRLQSALNTLARERTCQAVPITAPAPPPEIRPAALLAFGSQWQQREQQLEMTEAALGSRLATLQRVAGELADQRLCLAEQFERLARAQQQWQQDCQGAATELEAVGQRLRPREEALQIREQAVATAEQRLQQRSAEIARKQRHLEGNSARLAAGAASWEGERDRLLASLRAREHLVEQRLTALNDLRQRWSKRRQRQVWRLRARRGSLEELHKETEALRQEWLRRRTLLAKEQRALAERALALEQYRQQWIGRAAHPKAAEKRLERLRRRWAALAASAERTLAQERKSLETRAARLDERMRQFQHDAAELTTEGAELSTRQAAWEQQQLQNRGEQEKVRQELHSLRNQRQSYEQQLEALREEVERLARLLLDDNDPAPAAVAQAA